MGMIYGLNHNLLLGLYWLAILLFSVFVERCFLNILKVLIYVLLCGCILIVPCAFIFDGKFLLSMTEGRMGIIEIRLMVVLFPRSLSDCCRLA